MSGNTRAIYYKSVVPAKQIAFMKSANTRGLSPS